MGEVYAAEDMKLYRTVALKIYRSYAVKNETDLREGVYLLSTFSSTLATNSRPPASKELRAAH